MSSIIEFSHNYQRHGLRGINSTVKPSETKSSDANLLPRHCSLSGVPLEQQKSGNILILSSQTALAGRQLDPTIQLTGRLVMASRQLTGARQKSFTGNPHSTAGLHVPAQIRRPRKVLYLIAFFGALYWFSIRHGLGQERSDSFEKDHASHLKEPAPIPGNANRPPIRIAGGLKQVGKGTGAGGLWEGALGNLGLPRVAKKKTPDHHLRNDGYVEVQATPSAEHPICKLIVSCLPIRPTYSLPSSST